MIEALQSVSNALCCWLGACHGHRHGCTCTPAHHLSDLHLFGHVLLAGVCRIVVNVIVVLVTSCEMAQYSERSKPEASHINSLFSSICCLQYSTRRSCAPRRFRMQSLRAGSARATAGGRASQSVARHAFALYRPALPRVAASAASAARPSRRGVLRGAWRAPIAQHAQQ